ncbi:hypothetical protein Tco_0494599, partial [Tanacetum coccineum]
FSVTSCSDWTWKKGYPAVGRLSGICVDGSCVLKANGSNSDRRIFIHGEIGRDISQNQRWGLRHGVGGGGRGDDGCGGGGGGVRVWVVW